MRQFLRIAALSVSIAVLNGCGALSYYSQSIAGHLDLMGRARPISAVLDDPGIDADRKRILRRVLKMRAFASRDLGLPDNGSYTEFVDLGRPYVVWNVVAAPEFALAPVTSCFMVVGCLSYRGYFARADAEAYAQGLREQGLDVMVAGVGAYSTLGWFDDPLPNTLLRLPEFLLAETLYHELTHQQIYVKDDSAFNEALATAAGRIGARLWLEQERNTRQLAAYQAFERRQQRFLALVGDARSRLAAVYGGDLPEAAMREAKLRAFDDLRGAYARAKRDWGGYRGYDRWFAHDLNNAKLASVATYYRLVPGFMALYVANGRDFRAFLAAAGRLAELPPAARRARLIPDAVNAAVK